MLSIFYLSIQQYESVNHRIVKYYLIYQILTKTDYLQGRNFQGNLISRMAKLLFSFRPSYISGIVKFNKEKVIKELT